MGLAGATTAAGTGLARTFRLRALAGRGGGEHGKFLREAGRATLGTLRSLPVRGAHQHFRIAPALFTMKFVDRHEVKMRRNNVNLKGKFVAAGASRCAAKDRGRTRVRPLRYSQPAIRRLRRADVIEQPEVAVRDRPAWQ